MFTGIIEAQGSILGSAKSSGSYSIKIECPFASELTLGESVAVNGTCLTVTSKDSTSFNADVSPETVSRTSSFLTGTTVNLERAMKADGRFGGHIVSGHIDGTGKFLGAKKEGNSFIIKITADKKIARYLIEKGSVAINGISLTIASASYTQAGCIFTAAVIPHTWQNTNLCKMKTGDFVNIECDAVGKYIEHFMNQNKEEQYGSESFWNS